MNQQTQQKESKERKQEAASQFFHGGVEEKNDRKKESTKGRKSPSGTIKYIAIVVIAVLAIAGIGFMVISKDVSDLEGEWVRQPDDTDYAGMVVEFKQDGGRYVGIIKSTPVTDFSVGQEKWAKMTKAGFNTFYVYDLCGGGEVRVHTKLKVSMDGKTLYNNATNPSEVPAGANQLWKKK